MSILKRVGFNSDLITHYGNMFLIGNGHIGYRGTLEEYTKDDMVALNMVGIYDKYQDLWRESLNFPNPFYIYVDDYHIKTKSPIDHYQKLDLDKAIHYRKTVYDDVVIQSSRFIVSQAEDTICLKYLVKVKRNQSVNVHFHIDCDIFECNGPHYQSKNLDIQEYEIFFSAVTNEEKMVNMIISYQFNYPYRLENDGYVVKVDDNKPLIAYVFARINHQEALKSYREYYQIHLNEWKKLHQKAYIKITGSARARFNLDYSMYQLLTLGNAYQVTSIPARGVSGQTYKGAIFWDTEIFMLPVFTLTIPEIAEKLIEYRINTLPGALTKAEEYGYAGAFYAWESQEDGREACSKYNVTDWKTGEKLRTYFDEKQIHISIDIAYGILQYLKITTDKTIENKAIPVFEKIAEFYLSRATYTNGYYHLKDVIGPDEYHEEVDDNAYTNYLVKYCLDEISQLINNLSLQQQIKDFCQKLYLPPVQNHLIEQFTGYHQLEDVDVATVRSRLQNVNEYWGGKNGVATPTKVIKQADVITLLVLLNQLFSDEIKKANFDYYYPYTEHGSSLSSSMYGIIASQIGYNDLSYEMFNKTSSIDLGTNHKMYAGTIYIGGTHPASNAGAWLVLVFGMAGLKLNKGKISLNPHLPKAIKQLDFRITYLEKSYLITVTNQNYQISEVAND